MLERRDQFVEVPCVIYRFGYHDMPVEQLDADAVIDHFDELVAALCHL